MAELDAETASDIQEIRFRLEAIEATQLALVRNIAPDLIVKILELFESTNGLKEVYLLVDGKRTQSSILDQLKADGVKTSQPTLSRRIQDLRDNGLIDLVPTSTSGDVYEKNRVIERVTQLSRRLQ